MSSYQLGDMVVLICGSMRMGVEAVDGDMVACVWCHEGEIGRDNFHEKLLKKWEFREDGGHRGRDDDRRGGGKPHRGDRDGGGKPYRGDRDRDDRGHRGRDRDDRDDRGYRGRDRDDRDDRGYRGRDDRDDRPRGKTGWDGKPRDKKYFRKDD
ncbi:MAG: hypothetical protein AAF401_03385 [Pseudomonadota bacterium]